MKRYFPLFLVLFAVLGCGRQVTRIDPSTEIDLSGRWNDTDSRKVADQMIYELFDSDRYKEYAAAKKNKKTVIIVGIIRNKTSEHIDADNFVKKFEVVIHNSGAADLVESSEFRDMLRVERLEQQEFADPATVKEMGRELGAAILDTLRDAGYHSAVGVVALPNAASESLLQALGYERVGVIKEAGFKLDRWWDVALWQRELGARTKR